MCLVYANFLLPRQTGARPQVDSKVDSPARSLHTRLELHRLLLAEDPHEVGGVGEDDVVGEVEVAEGGQRGLAVGDLQARPGLTGLSCTFYILSQREGGEGCFYQDSILK